MGYWLLSVKCKGKVTRRKIAVHMAANSESRTVNRAQDSNDRCGINENDMWRKWRRWRKVFRHSATNVSSAILRI